VDGEWEACQTLTDESRERFGLIEQIPASILNYAIQLPNTPSGVCASPEEIQQQVDQALQATQASQQQPTTAAPQATVPPTGATSQQGVCSNAALVAEAERTCSSQGQFPSINFAGCSYSCYSP